MIDSYFDNAPPWSRHLKYAIPIIACLGCFWMSKCVFADDEFEHPPISYSASESKDPVAQLIAALKDGRAALEPDSHGSYVKSLLAALKVPESSQCLVFSKTSLQIPYIGPRTPRAIYFNDTVYVGVVIGSPIIELIGVDPHLGCVFYTFEREEKEYRLIRDRGQCLSCHATTRTERVPGVLVRSIYSDPTGRPRSGSSTYITDHRSPFTERWGGWYVTGQHGTIRHLGNVFATDREDPQLVDQEKGANRLELPASVSEGAHLNDQSDIVALMVLEHQTRMHNLITRANFESRQAAQLDKSMNEALGREATYVSDSTQRRVAAVGDALIAGLLFADESELTVPIVGTSGFAQEFSERGPMDSKGRSFYQLDMRKRMFRWPCSYLVLSDQMDALPESVSKYLTVELNGILIGEKSLPKGVRLGLNERESIREMIIELKPNWLTQK